LALRTKYQLLLLELASVLIAAFMPGRQAWAGPLANLFQLEEPAHLSLTIYGGGFGNDQYGSTHEGFQLEQSVTRDIGIVGTAAVYQLWKGTGGYDSPLSPSARSAVRDFGRFEGGIDFSPFQGTSFVILGGHDVGDSNAPVVEGEITSWLGVRTLHLVNLAFDGIPFFQNGVTSGTYDLRAIAASNARVMLLAGIGGAIWGGGTLKGVKTHGGPDLGIFVRSWHLNIDVQAGYGTAHTYGVVRLSRHFGWDE
jgi:hypothetical protein